MLSTITIKKPSIIVVDDKHDLVGVLLFLINVILYLHQ